MDRNWDRLREKLGGKWKVPVLQILRKRPQRFNMIKALLGISPNVLSNTLSEMTNHGLISKKQDRYAITEVGEKALSMITEMFELL